MINNVLESLGHIYEDSKITTSSKKINVRLEQVTF